MHDVVVFLGPSCSPERARSLLRARYLPPASRGDVTRAVAAGARIIGIIDGVFFQDCAVGHREILAALRAGVIVVGASSMGALRAAELDTLGMEGVGRIYEAYKSGELVSDDEVALVFDPESFVPLSETLVNIRYTVARAEDEGVIDRTAAKVLVAAASSLYFPERTYEAVGEGARGILPDAVVDRFCAYAADYAVDQKKEDAEAALRRIRAIAREQGIDADP
ncbi:MAG: TfuA-related McrA-glycine thioamidation protein [Methanomicrobiales archaeon]|nr:TfuA-related McrA-glycine thioamidation protein [Methanomicrobiales archaeon]